MTLSNRELTELPIKVRHEIIRMQLTLDTIRNICMDHSLSGNEALLQIHEQAMIGLKGGD